ncbi:CMRF35-like molecule 6 [Anabas testudineus]|uniref:CMRF35-like molecule 6 n=1 Tax=Anabas testudineus TaxID=64144 RepID=UPI000E45E8E3|nr:CMRF35-like molecule 6 [Anabas testudineus]
MTQTSIQTTYRSAETTIPCGNHQSTVQFFCRQNGSNCENILPSGPSPQTNRFTLTNSGSISIRDVSSQDDGVYWCGLGSSLTKIQLQVQNITVHEKSSSVGQTLTYWCSYSTSAPSITFICKGEDPSVCEHLVSSTEKNTGRFSMNDDKEKRNITVTVRDVRADDTGTYWCGAETSDRRSNVFFNKLVLTVASVTPTTAEPSVKIPSVDSTSFTDTPVPAAGPLMTAVTAVRTCVVLLVLLLVVVLIYKHSEKLKKQRSTGH